MVLIFLGVLIVFTVSSFEFHQVRVLDFIANDEWSQFIQIQFTGLSGLGQCWGLNKTCNRSQKPVPGF